MALRVGSLRSEQQDDSTLTSELSTQRLGQMGATFGLPIAQDRYSAALVVSAA